MSDTPGQVRIRVEAVAGRPPIAAAGTASDDAFGIAAVERRRVAHATSFGAPTVTKTSGFDAERQRIKRDQATPT